MIMKKLIPRQVRLIRIIIALIISGIVLLLIS